MPGPVPPARPKPLRRGEGPGIHVLRAAGEAWMAGKGPAMTVWSRGPNCSPKMCRLTLKGDTDSHSLMRGGSEPVTFPELERGCGGMDRIEQAFIATAVTGFLVMMAALVWMMMT
ncbi:MULTISPECIES: hypothetical protein [unclassified Bradyrhizobium]|uniref:hypothetical protein n=1 Tax=unclassified Bradyrhizobium TaxID=2631580 RepID=UPI00211DAA91|nr:MULTISPECIES: hypothetical protein [unclassified Bradyrhizobium]